MQQEARPVVPEPDDPPRASKLFRVLVVGGALLAAGAAAASAAAPHGEIGTAAQDSSDGGAPGW